MVMNSAAGLCLRWWASECPAALPVLQGVGGARVDRLVLALVGRVTPGAPIGAGKQDHGAQAPLGTTDPRLRETAARGW